MKNVVISFLICSLSLSSCGDDDDTSGNGENSDLTKNVTVNATAIFQTIDGFAASDCWTVNYIGKYWDVSQRESMARLLFSKEIKNGRPEGIGLSMWRFNLGAGTAEQGENSGIEDKSRRSECFLNADGTFDWTRQEGQQYFLDKAREYGCESFVMFSNSPPVYYAYNGKGYSARGSFSNLKEEHYTDFAGYMAEVAAHFKQNKNIIFNYISPVNEPQYNWNEPSQEGSGWQNSEIRQLVTELDKALTGHDLDSKILITEAGDWEYLYQVKNGAGRSNQIDDFFSTGSGNYIGNLKHVAPLIGGHSYWTDGNWNTLYQVRTQLAAKASIYGLKIYQTEWSMLGDHFNDKTYPGHESASYHDIALYMAQVMHHDLTTANVSSWSYWTSMDVSRWNHKNRFLLIELNPAGGAYGNISGSGTHQATKTLWVLGNYSLFVRPGYQRVDLTITNPSNSFFGSAWLSPEKDRLTIVYTNLTAKSIEVKLDIKGMNKNYISKKKYITSQTKDLKEEISDERDCIIEPESVTTIVYQF